MMRLLYHSVSYVDRASSTYTSDIGDLLVECLTNNAARLVTGVLAHNDGKFLQVVEGPVDAIDRLIVSIVRDPRHFDIHLIHRTRCDRREFPFWSMAYLSDEPNLRGIFEQLLGHPDAGQDQGNAIIGKLARMVA